MTRAKVSISFINFFTYTVVFKHFISHVPQVFSCPEVWIDWKMLNFCKTYIKVSPLKCFIDQKMKVLYRYSQASLYRFQTAWFLLDVLKGKVPECHWMILTETFQVVVCFRSRTCSFGRWQPPQAGSHPLTQCTKWRLFWLRDDKLQAGVRVTMPLDWYFRHREFFTAVNLVWTRSYARR